jgi:hypothetical protein
VDKGTLLVSWLVRLYLFLCLSRCLVTASNNADSLHCFHAYWLLSSLAVDWLCNCSISESESELRYNWWYSASRFALTSNFLGLMTKVFALTALSIIAVTTQRTMRTHHDDYKILISEMTYTEMYFLYVDKYHPNIQGRLGLRLWRFLSWDISYL